MASVRNVADWDAAHGIIQDALDAYGRVDVVVNNAGILRDTMFHKMTREEFDVVDDVNLRGVFYVSRAAAPHFKQQQSGCYVHMTSTSGLIGNLGQVNYGATKIGVAGLSKCIALDMQKFGVTSNAIAPFAWTRMVATIPDYAGEQEAARGQPALASPSGSRRSSSHSRARRGGRRPGRSSAYATTRSTSSASRGPIRTAHTADGWTPETIVERVLDGFQVQLHPARPVERSVHLGPGLIEPA